MPFTIRPIRAYPGKMNHRYGPVVVAIALMLGACSTTTTESSAPPEDQSPPPITTSTSNIDTSTTETTPAPATTEPTVEEVVDVFFGVDDPDCGRVEPYARQVPSGADPYLFAFEALLAGPTPDEIGAGTISIFSNETVGMVQSVDLSDGTLQVDFADLRVVIPNASTSCGSDAFLSALNATAFALEDVDRVGYSILGSCSVMFEWLQRECTAYTPTD